MSIKEMCFFTCKYFTFSLLSGKTTEAVLVVEFIFKQFLVFMYWACVLVPPPYLLWPNPRQLTTIPSSIPSYCCLLWPKGQVPPLDWLGRLTCWTESSSNVEAVRPLNRTLRDREETEQTTRRLCMPARWSIYSGACYTALHCCCVMFWPHITSVQEILRG